MNSEPNFSGLKRVAVNVPPGMTWQYRIIMHGDHPAPEHIWMLVAEVGAIHVSARLSTFDSRSEWIGGIECHYATPPEYLQGSKAHHEHCWILHKPCWHDGTSLGFSEQIAPFLPLHTHDFGEDEHAMVLSVMKHWHQSHFSSSEAPSPGIAGAGEGM